jgi:hypothetical protein
MQYNLSTIRPNSLPTAHVTLVSAATELNNHLLLPYACTLGLITEQIYMYPDLELGARNTVIPRIAQTASRACWTLASQY